MYRLEDLLKEVIGRGGSDLHLCSQSPPIMRLYGKLVKLDNRVSSPQEVSAMISGILTEEQKYELASKKNIDFAFEISIAGNSQRFRANVYYQRYGVDGVFRVIPSKIPSLGELNLPKALEVFTTVPEGLILITGSAGSGKTTTLSSILDMINSRHRLHIITIEDPVEFVIPIKQCLINQRQVGLHTRSFAAALRAAIREDPDIIVVGEMRDLETIQMAIIAAETGHCVFGTMHTAGAVKTIDRIIDSFNVDQQQQVRAMLSDSLRGVIGQQLLTRADGWGLIPAVEILLATRPVCNTIREGKTHQLSTIIQTGRAQGMQMMDDEILKLLQEGKIEAETAYEYAVEKKNFEPYLKKTGKMGY
ncbi:MAG: PilT/PilU family type 4a pilus ATPase [Candidatus Eremiobacteraeota bacterium]|nr:PilT/PilU family type 4a pilus ATPase [Candidatus Eremiobacteraeota bacterium]